MQTSVPDLMDLSKETKETFDLYGTKGGDGSFAANCLLARRLAERGVRFIQLYHRDWDHHGGIKNDIEVVAKEVDQGAAALLKDLKRRGMLKDTLVIWGGEFGRTPMAQGDGRDHHIKGFSMWLAGGGVKGGITHGATDEFGYNAVENPVHVHDLHATMLRLLGDRPRTADVPLPGAEFPADGRVGRRGEGDPGVSVGPSRLTGASQVSQTARHALFHRRFAGVEHQPPDANRLRRGFPRKVESESAVPGRMAAPLHVPFEPLPRDLILAHAFDDVRSFVQRRGQRQ